jgi:hypothetical protein
MRFLKLTFIISICFVCFSGCNTLGVGIQGSGSSNPKYHKQGPPSHAPAHGYRDKHHDGNELEYDKELGVYIVVNAPETYFGNNLYIRLSTSGKWIVSIKLEGAWRIAVENEVPYKLKEYKGKKKKKVKKEKRHKKK